MPYDTNYATLEEWGDEEEPIEEISGEVEELYYDKYTGQLYIGFNDPEGNFHSFMITIEATNDWNEFVDSLPKWNIPE